MFILGNERVEFSSLPSSWFHFQINSIKKYLFIIWLPRVLVAAHGSFFAARWMFHFSAWD